MSDEINELQREWRAIVLEKLSALEDGQSRMRSDIVDIKTSFVKQQTVDALRLYYEEKLEKIHDNIEDLKAFKWKVIGIASAASAIIGILIEVVFRFAK